MIAAATPDLTDEAPARRFTVTPAIELAVLAVAVAIGIASYFIVSRAGASQQFIAPPLLALLLVANLVPGIGILMLIGRRIARRRAARSLIGGSGQLHVRLVALFSAAAAIPMLLVTIVASLLFQYGVEFWSSQRAQSMLNNAASLVLENYEKEIQRVADETRR